MNIAIIIAGGLGVRFGSSVPKQFVLVNGIPVIALTIKQFQEHSEINEVGIVCLKHYIQDLKNIIVKYNFNKVKWIVPGGSTGFASIRQGLNKAKDLYKDSDLILIHDAVRPLVTKDIISDCIRVASTCGNATACIPCATVVLRKNGQCGQLSTEVVEREQIMLTQTPQALKLGEFIELHRLADLNNIIDSVATCTLLIQLKKQAFFSKGDEINIKITTKSDFLILKSMIESGVIVY